MTPKQKQIFDFIVAFMREKGYSPSFPEIAAGMGLRSLATVHVHLKKMERKGLLERDHKRSRSIRVPHKHCPFCFKPGKDSGVF